MHRQLEIVRSQFSQLSLREFCGLMTRNLYTNDPLLVYRLVLEDAVMPASHCGPGIMIEKGDLLSLSKESKRLTPLPWEFQCHRYDGVEDFFVAKDEEGIQHISWIYMCRHRNRLLRLGEREAEIKFCLTLPALRGRGIYPKVIGAIAAYLQGRGFTHLYMCVHRDNLASIRGIEKAGLVKCGQMRLRKLGGIQLSKRLQTGAM